MPRLCLVHVMLLVESTKDSEILSYSVAPTVNSSHLLIPPVNFNVLPGITMSSRPLELSVLAESAAMKLAV